MNAIWDKGNVTRVLLVNGEPLNYQVEYKPIVIPIPTELPNRKLNRQPTVETNSLSENTQSNKRKVL